MTVLINRFNVLSAAVENSADRKRLKAEVRDRMTPFAQSLIRRLRALTPDGSKWNDPIDVFAMRKIFPAIESERPSLRQHGITMLAGWLEPTIDFKGSGRNSVRASMTVINTAPQSRWIIEGTENPAGNLIRPKSANPKSHLWFFNFRTRSTSRQPFVVHKGISPDFGLRVVLDEAQYDANSRFDDLRNEIFKPLRDL